METGSTAQRVAGVAPARSFIATALVETAYLSLRLAAVVILAAPLLVAAFLLLG
jgi:hypothetical protein